jgi:hypothetical protein
MSGSAQKNNSTTQRFTEIVDISEDVVLLSGNNACSIIEVRATNFALLSMEEQNSKVYSYAALLNSLSFSIQIVIRSKKLDISSYLKLLDGEARNTQNEMLATQIKLYRDFVQELVKVNVVLDKNFYICVPYSYLEKGAVSATTAIANKQGSKSTFLDEAKIALHTKLDALHSQLARLNLGARTLNKEELVKLYYEIYNDTPIATAQLTENVKTAVIRKGDE